MTTEEKTVKKSAQTTNSGTAADKEPRQKGRIFDWVDAGMKIVIALVGLWVSYLGYSYQKSFTTSQLLVQQEKGDTDIRAQMFGKITDRLMKPPEKDKVSLEQDALLAQVLALNFHELIELKPLMIDLDERLGREIEKIASADASDPDLELKVKARGNLRSAARRIRDRQVASLINTPRPGGDLAAPALAKVEGAGRLYYVSILRKGLKSRNRCLVNEQEGKNGCLGELMEFSGPSKERAMYLSVDGADWKKESFKVSLNCGKPARKPVLPVLPDLKPGETRQELKPVEECREGLAKGVFTQTAIEPGHKEFEVTWYDFPFTDNTLQADGNRYAIFIDQVCRDADAKPEDEPNAVRLGLLYFPKDYYPSRERPVSYKQLSDKLGLKESD